MARLTPDPSFYPSPGSAAQAPPETLAYVATLNTDSSPDAIAVLDLEAGEIVGRFDMPNVGDELHHFGWNACSSALCPWAAHPHVERRYLLVPGLRSSRIHVLDVKDDPRSPKLVKVIEADEIAKKAGYSRPHTVHCGPDGIYVSALGNPEGDGPGGIFLLDHDNFSVKGAWEEDRGTQELAYDFWWHLNYDTVITSEWGTPNMVEDGLVGELLLGNQYGHKLHVFDLKTRRHRQEIDLGAEHQMVLELRPAHDPSKTYGFVGVVTSTADLTASIWLWERAEDGSVSAEKVISIAPEPAEAEQLPPILQPFGAVPPLITDIALSVDDRSLYVSCWGTGEL
jgi:selenium-binding protein 1